MKLQILKHSFIALLFALLVACSSETATAPENPGNGPGTAPPTVPVNDPWDEGEVHAVEEEPVIVPSDEETDPVRDGRVAYNMPREMVLGRSYFAEILIQPFEDGQLIEEIDEALLDQLGITENIAPVTDELPLIETVETSREMSVEIRAANADVSPLSETRQETSFGSATPWLWEINPTQAGETKLTVIVYRHLTIDDRETRRIAGIKQFDANVVSKSDLLQVRAPSVAAPSVAASASSDAVMSEADLAQSGCEVFPAREDSDRWALVISNQNYSSAVGQLSNTHLDNDRIATSLIATGFNVTQCRDIGSLETRNALSTFARDLDEQIEAGSDPVAFFYYSGHGINLGGRNFMVPIDMPDVNDTTIETYGIGFDEVLNRIWFPNSSTSFAVFDACRNVYGNSKGLQPIVAHATGAGLFQAFATAPGKVAADNGYYSEALSNLLPEAGVRAELVFNRVQDAVAERTGYAQIPFNNDGIAGEFYFVDP